MTATDQAELQKDRKANKYRETASGVYAEGQRRVWVWGQPENRAGRKYIKKKQCIHKKLKTDF